ncbi:dihydrolipoyl dehydrogenase [Desulfoluna spongiiphila]|uniref:Dihydrolipoyl dehydrogenase n=1 Tax=Desulfoluna spongiiphila TaxID=419481 RepID=A0A1G5H6X1_9BACT|nr:dihydrolipoyl dehydrogenase [Desulfoluna spongiiphila]SCY58678.1 dihydrolipoamide dehydrogenase [Desulfoluna spongiiphila]VVS94803.1 dihydrolipoamide dehydrogenase [Desulfoluna spongiiphila]
MAKRIIVIGAGPGGYVAALKAAALGAEVTVVEKEGAGGTCLNWGCIPSKIMKTSADLMEKMAQSETFGIEQVGSVAVNMAGLMERKRSVIATQQKGILALFQRAGVTWIHGSARIAGKGRLAVTDENGETSDLYWDNLIIATGTVPMALSAFPFDGKRVVSSNEVLSLSEVPESIAIVGGGVIGCEFAFILNALGAKVTLIEGMDRVLPIDSVDEACSKLLTREMKKKKITLYTNRTVTGVETADECARVTIGPSPFAENPTAKEKEILTEEVAMVAFCVGRSPNSSDIGLEHTGVTVDDRGWIRVDDGMRTSDPAIYAIGDITGPERIMLAHVASAEGVVAAENIMGQDRTMDYTAVPNAIFTMPEVACTGLTEAQARNQGLDVRTDTVLFRAIGKAQVLGEIAGQASIVSETDTGRVLGVHIAGPHATDLIAEGTLAVNKRLTVTDLAETIHAHPTLAEAMLEVALKASGNALHG